MTHFRGLEIQNLRGIRHLRLEDLGDINLITGLNDVGKSTVLEAVFLNACGPLAAQNALGALRGPNGLELGSGFGPQSQTGPWDTIFYRLETSHPVEIRATFRGGSHVVRLEEGSDTSSIDIARVVSSGTETQAGTSAGITIRDIRNDGPGETYKQTIKVSISEGDDPSRRTVNLVSRLEPTPSGPFMLAHYIHGVLGPNLAEGYSELRRTRSSIDLLEALQLIDPRIEALEVLAINGQPTLHVDFGDGPLIPINLLGDGATTVARYLIALAQCKGGILLLDEVGSGVHHSLQRDLWRVLARAAKRFDVQVFATTHSDESIRGAMEGIKNDNNEVRVIRLWRDDDGVINSSIYSGSELRSALDVNLELR
jgi:hypothetical protein